MSMLKNFAKVVDLEERQVLFLKTERTEEEREEDSECDEHPYLLELRYYLLDGETAAEVKLSFGTVESRDRAFDLADAAAARGLVDKSAWMENILVAGHDDEEDDDDLLEDEDDCC